MKSIMLFFFFAVIYFLNMGCGSSKSLTADSEPPSDKAEKKLTKTTLKAYSKDIDNAIPCRDVSRLRMVSNVSGRIFEATQTYLATLGETKRLRKFDWEVQLVEDKEASLCFTPGGNLIVNTGILSYITNDDELAMLIAHDIAHVVSGNSMARLNRIWQGQKAAGGGIPIIRKSKQKRQAVRMAFGFGGQPGGAFPYHAGPEMDADKLGLNLVAMAGYDPHQAPLVWQRLEQQPCAFYNVHAANDDKTEQFDALIPAAIEYARVFGKTPSEKTVQVKVNVEPIIIPCNQKDNSLQGHAKGEDYVPSTGNFQSSQQPMENEPTFNYKSS